MAACELHRPRPCSCSSSCQQPQGRVWGQSRSSGGARGADPRALSAHPLGCLWGFGFAPRGNKHKVITAVGKEEL